MNNKRIAFCTAALLVALATQAQTVTRTFYVDYGQNNVTNQGFLTATDQNGHVWNNLHGAGTGAPDKIYALTQTDLVASDGSTTSCKVQVGTTFATNGYSNGGLNNPSEALLGDMAVQTATQDYFFLEGGQDYGIIRFSGLDKTKGYKFFSFGSREDSGTPGRVATFDFRGLNRWQGEHVMGAKGIGDGGVNRNNNNIQESDYIFPDANGIIEMTIIKKVKNGMVHINAMKVVEYEGISHPYQQYTLSRKMYFDLGENGKAGNRGDITSSPDQNGNYWNNLSCPTSGSSVAAGTVVNVVSSDNKATGIKLTNMVAFNANGYNNGGLKEPSEALLGDLAVAGATQDYIYTENKGVATLLFSGLDKTKRYRFHIFGTRTDTGGLRSTVLRLNGENEWMSVQTTSGPNTGGQGVAQNVGNICVSDFMTPDAVGNIIFTFRQNEAPSCNFGHVSVVKVEEWNTAGAEEEAPAIAGDQRFYIDFGEYNVADRGNLTEGADQNGNYWTNAFSSPKEKMYPRSFALTNSAGQQSGYTMTFGTYFHTNGMSGGGGLLEPSASLLGDLAVGTATQDYIHMEGSQDYNVIHFRGLNCEKAYRFHCFGHRQATDDRAGVFRFTGENEWEGQMAMSGTAIGDGGYNGNNNKILVSDPIFPDKDGNIDLTMMKVYTGGLVYLNCMKIEEVSGLERPGQELTLVNKMYFDFGETSNDSRGHQTTGKDKNGNYWNNISSGSSSSNKITANKRFTIRNSSGTLISRTVLTILHDSYTNGINAGGNNSPSATDLGDLAIQTATEDYMFIDNGDTRSFTLTGLKPAHCYRMYIYGTRNHTDTRVTQYTITGQRTWVGGQATSGYDVGGYGVPGNLRNVLVTDYIYPDRSGTIQVDMVRIYGMAHISAMKIEEYEGGTRPEEPLEFASLSVGGNAEDAIFQPVSGKKGMYEAYARLTAGTFTLSGTIEDDGAHTLGSDGQGGFVLDGEEPFSVANDCVARITINADEQSISILPVTMHVRGNMGAGNPVIPYKGAGVFEGEVTLKETTSQQWVDKTMYFALNNNDSYAIKRLQGAATRYVLGEAERGQSVENIYQNAGTYTITVDMANKVYNINKVVDENRISVFGSSVANGQGATDYKGYRYLYGQNLIRRYENGESETPFYTTNVSIGGNTTNNLLGRYDDLIRDFGRYVIFGLSLGNEGIHGASNQQAVFEQWRDNMLTLINRVKADGKIPMVMNNYTRSDYNESDYSYVKQLNLLIHQWDVASTNCLGSIDDGTGKWAAGYISDTYHQNTAGHFEFFYSMVPSLFDAIKAGKAQPKRSLAKSMTLEAGKQLAFQPEDVARPFTVTVRVKAGEGSIFSVLTSDGKATVWQNADGTVTLTMPTGETVTSTSTLTGTGWYYVTLTSYYAAKRTILYINKTKAGEVGKRMGEVQKVCVGGTDSSRDISELFFWRSGMTPEEINAVCDGKTLKSSLEIYVATEDKQSLTNLAQSTNTVVYEPAGSAKLVKTLATNVTYRAETGDAGFSANENFFSLVDGTNKKWCLNLNEGSSVHTIFHASQPICLSGYKITTGGDCATWTGRNPKAWKLYGSTAAAGINADDASWELITEVTNDTKLQDVNSTTYTYTLPSPTQKAYTCFKWVITARKGGGSGVIQVEEFTPIVASSLPSRPVSISIDEGTRGWGDEVDNILDDDITTKWNCWFSDGQAYAIFHTSEPIRINGYEITTGNDNEQYQQRNPKTWKLYGSNAAAQPGVGDPSWEVIYSVVDDQVLEDINMKTYQYVGTPTRKAYKYYKWAITATQGSMVQVGEFNLYAYEENHIGLQDITTIPSAEWSTYVTPFDADFSQTSGLTAYQVTELMAKGYVCLESVTHVAKGNAVVLNGTAGTYTIHASDATQLDDMSHNILLPTFANTLVDAEQTYFVVAQPTDEPVGFYAARESTYIPAYKGYLYSPGSFVKVFFFSEDDATGIKATRASEEGNVMYNLAGQRVSAAARRGIYVVNGHKVMR